MDAGTVDERAELLRYCGLLATGLAADGLLGDRSVAAATLHLYEWMTGPQVACFRCAHDWEKHEPPELAAVPEEALEDAVRAHPELAYACRVPGCGCARFLTYDKAVREHCGAVTPDDIRRAIDYLELLGKDLP